MCAQHRQRKRDGRDRAVESDLKLDARRVIEACKKGSASMTRSTVAMMLAPGWRNDHDQDAGFPVEAAGVVNVGVGVADGGDVAKPDGGAIAIGNDQG